MVAVLIDAVAYGKLPSQGQKTTVKGIIISILAGVLMGFFYRFVAASMSEDFVNPVAGKFTPIPPWWFFLWGCFFPIFYGTP